MLLPFELQLAGGGSRAGERHLVFLDQRRWFTHRHFDAAQIQTGIVTQAPLPGFLVQDQLPVVRIRYPDVDCVVPFGDSQAADIEIRVRVKGCRGIRAGAPGGIRWIHRKQAARTEDLPSTNGRC